MRLAEEGIPFVLEREAKLEHFVPAGEHVAALVVIPSPVLSGARCRFSVRRSLLNAGAVTGVADAGPRTSFSDSPDPKSARWVIVVAGRAFSGGSNSIPRLSAS